MRSQLLLGILLPVGVVVALNAWGLYRQALRAADTAYDRTLLASAKAIGELLDVDGSHGPPRLLATVPYSALEAFEADNRSRIYFKVTGFEGEMVSGFGDLPAWKGKLPDRGIYAALVDFYDDHYRGEPVRVAVLLQPVSGQAGQGMATIQVAETLELRHTLARQVLVDTLWRQAALLALIAVVVVVVVQRATRPVRALSAALSARDDDDLSPLQGPAPPRELQPLVDATNGAMARLAHLLANQKRFVRDAAHQLRTPLAVLKTQVQSARRGDLPAPQALAEIAVTVDRATQLANQMLALAKVEQLRHQGDAPVLDWADEVRAVALDLAPLIAERELDFDIRTAPAPVRAHGWALRELTRNLLHNAVRACPAGGPLTVAVSVEPALAGGGGGGDHGDSPSPAAWARLAITDCGPGISDGLRQRLFQPFAGSGGGSGGVGLGLVIVRDVVLSLGGSLALDNAATAASGPGTGAAASTGLVASVRLPVVDNPTP